MKKIVLFLLVLLSLTGCANEADIAKIRTSDKEEMRDCIKQGKYPVWYYREVDAWSLMGVECFEINQK